MKTESESQVSKIFAWGAGIVIVGIFVIAVFIPDLARGYVDASVENASISSGQRVYEIYCIGCHGVDGDGIGEASEVLNPKPRNFVDGDFKFFHFGEAGPLPSDASLALTIRNGLPGSAMPAFPLLSEQEVSDSITYLQNFRAGGWTESAATGVGEVASAPAIEGETGEDLFLAGGCNGCHQLDELNSVGGIGPSLNDAGGRLSIDELKSSIIEPNSVIAEICPAGPCPENVMPGNFGDRLTPEQIDTLAQYLAEQQ
jgi:mono/diheme cytochrome c family protein